MHVSNSDMFKLMKLMREFQLVHNELRKDYLKIYDLVQGSKHNAEQTPPLIRACLKELFSLMEADIYLYNKWNPYPGYFDRESFLTKFKRTYKNHAATFPNENRAVLDSGYKSRYIELLVALLRKRDAVTHPKGLGSIRLNDSDLQQIHTLYERYTDFIKEMFVNVLVEVKERKH